MAAVAFVLERRVVGDPDAQRKARRGEARQGEARQGKARNLQYLFIKVTEWLRLLTCRRAELKDRRGVSWQAWEAIDNLLGLSRQVGGEVSVALQRITYSRVGKNSVCTAQTGYFRWEWQTRGHAPVAVV